MRIVFSIISRVWLNLLALYYSCKTVTHKANVTSEL